MSSSFRFSYFLRCQLSENLYECIYIRFQVFKEVSVQFIVTSRSLRDEYHL